jgi:hypothetical protein
MACRCRRLTTIAVLAWAACNHTGSPAGAGGADCSGGPFVSECDQCIESTCCAQAAVCYADPTCTGCAAGTPSSPASCATGMTPAWDALLACMTAQCNGPCVAHSTCNPVTNAGCGDAGAACDLDQDGVFVCFPGPTPAPLCASCSNENGPYCSGTSHCLEQGGGGRCARYCCDDGDCGAGVCDMGSLPGGVGVCVVMLDAGVDPECSESATVPSHGFCFNPPPPTDGGNG